MYTLVLGVDDQLLLLGIVKAVDSLYGVEHKEAEHKNRSQDQSDNYSHKRALGKSANAVGDFSAEASEVFLFVDCAKWLDLNIK